MPFWNLFLILLLTQGCPFVDQPSIADITRAKSTRPRKALLGYGAASIRRQLNQHLEYGHVGYPEGMARPCEDFTVEELNKIQKAMSECSYESPMLGSFYQDRRRLSRELHPSILKVALLTNDSETLSALKVGICHIFAMQWVHRLTDATRKAFADRVDITSLPLLPQLGAAEHLPALSTKGALGKKVSSWLQDSVTCEIGHDASPEPAGEWSPADLPVWPYEVTYNASGYGPYPFWCDGSPNSGAVTGPGADVSVWYSAVQNAERFDHSSCSLSDMGTTDGPCTNLFVNGSWSFLFKQDLSFCCMSSAPAYRAACHLTRPQRDFMDVMNFDGVDDYTAEDGLYTGKAKKWSMHLSHPSNFYFWYVTDEDGWPLEQGEGPCNMYNDEGTRDCEAPPKMLFHQYHPGTFQATEIPSSVFDVPEVCRDTRTRGTCLTEPANLCR